MADDLVIPAMPVQLPNRPHERPRVRNAVVLRAYEVYCHVYGAQPAMVEGDCRGGFSAGEIMAYLYARAFPKGEWRERVDEAFKGMVNL